MGKEAEGVLVGSEGREIAMGKVDEDVIMMANVDEDVLVVSKFGEGFYVNLLVSIIVVTTL